MSNAPRPDLWYPIAHLLIALRKLLRAAAPEAFSAIAREVRVPLTVITALLRRYIHVLAAEIILPPPRAPRPQAEHAERPRAARKADRYLFPLLEIPARPSCASDGEDAPDLQWALLMEAARRLAEVLANPAPHARRLARRFGTLDVPGLRDLALPWHILRQIPPWLDVLVCRYDAAARPSRAAMDRSDQPSSSNSSNWLRSRKLICP
jgi:hypothetical protein